MKIAITGSSGFIGKALSVYLSSKGHTIVPLGRSQLPIEGFDAIIHLAGEPLSFNRWSQDKKKKIFESRAQGTEQLVKGLLFSQKPPKVFISASAVGFYGNREEEVLNENSKKGEGFLSDVCHAWESAALPLKNKGVRVAHTRFGMVIGQGGGALQKMLPIYKLGLGATLGSGQQWVSWVYLFDLIRAIEFILIHDDCHGPFNIVSPRPLRQHEFSKTIARVLHRPHIFKIPEAILRFIFGSMADELLLSSIKVEPKKLLSLGFEFQAINFDEALKKSIPQ